MDIIRTEVIKGFLCGISAGDISDELGIFIKDEDTCEAMLLPEAWDDKNLNRKNVTLRYWLSDKELSKDELITDFLNMVYGETSAYSGSVYSECTGYLWTDNVLKVGGHDLVKELCNKKGKYLYMEIGVHGK